uniref:Uncharacterized protein n=1 Tax=Arundo donax TaxID=35708 RepID=A0A0A8YRC2_ARUDO
MGYLHSYLDVERHFWKQLGTARLPIFFLPLFGAIFASFFSIPMVARGSSKTFDLMSLQIA